MLMTTLTYINSLSLLNTVTCHCSLWLTASCIFIAFFRRKLLLF